MLLAPSYLFSYLEVPLSFWKAHISSNSNSSGRKFLHNNILLMQKTCQPFTAGKHPAVSMGCPFAPIKFDGLPGHLVLLQHSGAYRAEAHQQTCNMHPNLWFCLHPRVKNQRYEQGQICDMTNRKMTCWSKRLKPKNKWFFCTQQFKLLSKSLKILHRQSW